MRRPNSSTDTAILISPSQRQASASHFLVFCSQYLCGSGQFKTAAQVVVLLRLGWFVAWGAARARETPRKFDLRRHSNRYRLPQLGCTAGMELALGNERFRARSRAHYDINQSSAAETCWSARHSEVEMVRLNLLWAAGACACPALATRALRNENTHPLLIGLGITFAVFGLWSSFFSPKDSPQPQSLPKL